MSDLTKIYWRSHVGTTGEAAVKKELEAQGWTVTDLNSTQRNTPNVDITAQKGNRIVNIQVKTYNDYCWISGGGVNATICAGGSLFNKKKSTIYCDFVICVTPASPGDKRNAREDWRFFVMPVTIADKLFQININAYFNFPKKNGSARVKTGAVQDFVGPGRINSNIVPDHQKDYHPFENNFQILETTV
jgi:hypothetical protein